MDSFTTEGPQNVANLADDYRNTTFMTSPSPEEFSDNILDGIVSDQFVYWFQVLLCFGISGSISIVGMCGNIINIVVFCRQGILTDSSNTMLTGLAFADFWCLLTIFLTGVFFIVHREAPPDLDWNPEGVMFIVSGWPHVMFSQIACWITAGLAFERCICVVFPFKVKTMFSAKRSLVVVVVIFITTILCYCPVFATNQLGWVYSPVANRTILSVKFLKYKEEAADASNYFNTLFCRSASVLTVFVCTRITTYKVISSTKWRKSVAQTGSSITKKSTQQKISNSNSSKEENHDGVNTTTAINISDQPVISQKETRLVRMITTICIIFLICYTPDIFLVYIRIGFPTISFAGPHHNLFYVLYILSFFLESINSSINIIVYYHLSSRYRQEFRRLFHLA